MKTSTLLILIAGFCALVWAIRRAATRDIAREEWEQDQADFQTMSNQSLGLRLAVEPVMAMSLRPVARQYDGFTQISGDVAAFSA